MYNLLSTVLLYMAKYFPVPKEPHSFAFVTDHFKIQEMCNEAIEKVPWLIYFVPDHFWTQEMCNKIIRAMPEDTFHYIPDRLQTQEICEKAVTDDPSFLHFVPDQFVTQQQLKIWHDDDVYCNDDGLIEWYEGYKKRQAQKASIKKGLMPIAWHPLRYWDWCMSEDEKIETEKLRR